MSSVLSNLTHLDVSSCRYVTATTVSLLQENRANSITDLVLSRCGIEVAGLRWEIPHLVRLEVAQYFVADDGILYSLARNCPLLQKLVLSGCHSVCTDGTLPLFNLLSSPSPFFVSIINLMASSIENAIIAMTRKCNRLVHLDLAETAANDSTMQKVAQHLEHLTFLSLLSYSPS